jgi:SAM-dependent methyltransferase
VARARLAPLGAAVIAVAGAPDNADQSDAAALPALPFADASFRLVTNRHESFVASEIARVLAPGGGFITQQITSDFDAPLRVTIGAPARQLARRWRLREALEQVGRIGLEVVASGEGDALMIFTDIGALAWYLTHVPWVLPEFTIAGYRKQLERMHEKGAITVRQPIFWLDARKPAQG